MKQINNTGSLRHSELEALYAIGRVAAETVDIDIAMDNIIQLTRKVFIFDNVVLYSFNKEDHLEPVFARAIGRGRSSEADMAWGEKAAKEVINTGRNYVHQGKIIPDGNRLDQHFFLGLPMLVRGINIGALVFIRFGGPEFTLDQINFAEFIATHISQLFEREKLVEMVANLEAERKLNLLQDDFIAMVSHDLNTPLGFIKGYTTTLLRKDTKWDQQTQIEFLTIIDEETDRLSEMIENLLDSSRLQSQTLPMEFKPLYLDELSSIQIERLTFLYPQLTIKLDIKNQLIPVNIDSKRFSQVLDNIMSNAAKYAPNCNILVTVSQNEINATITIKDDGPGIESNHLNHLFERFYRVPEQRAGVRGSGLGLFICDLIIKAHHGKILVDSQIDHGTSFCIQLPISDEKVKVLNG